MGFQQLFYFRIGFGAKIALAREVEERGDFYSFLADGAGIVRRERREGKKESEVAFAGFSDGNEDSIDGFGRGKRELEGKARVAFALRLVGRGVFRIRRVYSEGSFKKRRSGKFNRRKGPRFQKKDVLFLEPSGSARNQRFCSVLVSLNPE